MTLAELLLKTLSSDFDQHVSETSIDQIHKYISARCPEFITHLTAEAESVCINNASATLAGIIGLLHAIHAYGIPTNLQAIFDGEEV